MTLGATYDDRDPLSAYLGSTGTSGIAAALSGTFSASPSFEMSSALPPSATMALAGTGLSAARNVNVGALSYDEALNYAPAGGKMLPAPSLDGFDFTDPVNLILLAGAAFFGRRQFGTLGLVLGPLAAIGVAKLLEK